MAKWYDVTVITSSEAADLVADIFFSEGCQGVSVRDKNDLIELYKSSIIWDYIDQSVLDGYDDRVYVNAVYGDEDLALNLQRLEQALSQLKADSPFDVGAAEISVSELKDADWRSEWKKYYKPIVTASVTVVPKWIKYGGTGTPLYINPGMAFGTGEHETTKMCLELLAEVDVKGKRVSDAGTGSGILGIAALIMGASSANMFDIDQAAVITAKENAELNGVLDRAVIYRAASFEGAEESDLIFANITADVLISLMKAIAANAADGGSIILSGIINDKADGVKESALSCGLTLIKHVNTGEWNALLLKK